MSQGEPEVDLVKLRELKTNAQEFDDPSWWELTDYLWDSIPAILSLAERVAELERMLREDDAVIHDLWHQEEPHFKPSLDYGTKWALAVAACDRHRARQQAAGEKV